MANRSYSVETKAAVMTALLSGQSTNQIAVDYNIPIGTIRSWKSREEIINGRTAIIATEKKEVATLIVDLLEAQLETAKRIIDSIDGEYIKEQGASEVAVLFGVISDKTFRMLEALGRAEDKDTFT